MKLKTKFQDEDFELGEVADVNIATMPDGRIKAQAVAKSGGVHTFFYDDLKTFTDDWEDVPEEPENFYIVEQRGTVGSRFRTGDEYEKTFKEIGNYFETKEEAEKAVKKLKVITRLNKCGFRFEGYNDRDRASGGDIVIYAHVDTPNNNLLEEAQPAMLKDLDLLFGGEE